VRRRPLGHKKRPVPDAGFAAVTDEVSRLYGEGRYQDGADLVARARPHLPERDCPLTFWEGCCQSMAGNPEPAVEILRCGHGQGERKGGGAHDEPFVVHRPPPSTVRRE
jgi:hypothetical protein